MLEGVKVSHFSPFHSQAHSNWLKRERLLTIHFSLLTTLVDGCSFKSSKRARRRMTMENDFAVAKKHTGSSMWFIESKVDGGVIYSAMSHEWMKEVMQRIQEDYSKFSISRKFM